MTKKVKFIPIKNGDLIDLGDLGIFGVSGTSKYLGFKPAGGKKLAGWIVVALGSRNLPHKKRERSAM